MPPAVLVGRLAASLGQPRSPTGQRLRAQRAIHYGFGAGLGVAYSVAATRWPWRDAGPRNARRPRDLRGHPRLRPPRARNPATAVAAGARGGGVGVGIARPSSAQRSRPRAGHPRAGTSPHRGTPDPSPAISSSAVGCTRVRAGFVAPSELYRCPRDPAGRAAGRSASPAAASVAGSGPASFPRQWSMWIAFGFTEYLKSLYVQCSSSASVIPIANRDAHAIHRRSGSPDLRLRSQVWDPGADLAACQRSGPGNHSPLSPVWRPALRWVAFSWLRQLGDQRSGKCHRRPLPCRRHRLGVHRFFGAARCRRGCDCGGPGSGSLRSADAMRLAAVLFLISALGTGLVDSLAWLIVFRVIGGVGVGMASVVAPAYIAEIAPARVAGSTGLSATAGDRVGDLRVAAGRLCVCDRGRRLRTSHFGWASRRGGGCSWR